MNNEQFNIIEIEENLKKEEIYSITNKRGSSPVWSIFGSVVKKDDNSEIPGIVACRVCKKVIQHRTSSTSNLVKHSCYKKRSDSKTVASGDDKKKMIEVLANFCIKDGVPFSIVEGEGFNELIQEVLNIGAKYNTSQIDLNSLLPNPTTISNKVEAVYDQYLPKFKQSLKTVKYFGVTTDLWTDRYKHFSYIGITLHYVDGNKVIDRVLCVKHFDMPEASGLNLRKVVEDVLLEFGLNIVYCVFITDRGANIKAALRDYVRYDCVDHKINNALSNGTKDVAIISDFLEKCSKLVKFFKKSNNLMMDFHTTLKAAGSTRWNSHLTMLKSICDNFPQIVQKLEDKNCLYRLNGIDIEQIKKFVAFLEPFKIASDQLQASKVPTIHKIILNVEYLKEVCQLPEDDSEELKILKTSVSEILNKFWSDINQDDMQFYYSALLLYPVTKTLETLNDENKRKVYTKLFSLCEIDDDENAQDENEINYDNVPEPLRKFLPNRITQQKRTPSVREELEEYLRESVDHNIMFNIDVLDYWNNKKNQYPKLYDIVQRIFCVPASSAASERSFSLASNIQTIKRTRLSTTKISQLCFLKSNLKADDD